MLVGFIGLVGFMGLVGLIGLFGRVGLFELRVCAVAGKVQGLWGLGV